MCALCNNNDPSWLEKRHMKGQTLRKEYAKIVKDYTGEEPCSHALKKIGTTMWEKKVTIDAYIIDRLLSVYNTSGTSIGEANAIIYMKENITRERVQRHIRKVTNNKTGIVRFTVDIRINKKPTASNFIELDDAITYKNEILKKRKENNV